MQTGRPLDEEEEFYAKWAMEVIKDNLVTVNEIARQMLTISAALLGVSIFYEKILIDGLLKNVCIALFLAAFILSFFCILPYSSVIDIADIQAFKSSKRQAFKMRYRLVFTAGLFVIIGCTVICICIFLK